MFYYFGRKAKLAPKYPLPLHGVPIIEPFGGSCAWTLYHMERGWVGDGIATEANPEVHTMWHALLNDTLPPLSLIAGDVVNGTREKMAFTSYWALRPGKRVVSRHVEKVYPAMCRLADRQRPFARRIDYRLDTYESLPDIEATWFIDPPYQKVEHDGYANFGAAQIDYGRLAEFCRTRRGRVIVCEQQGADWLQFTPLTTVRARAGLTTNEVVWISG